MPDLGALFDDLCDPTVYTKDVGGGVTGSDKTILRN